MFGTVFKAKTAQQFKTAHFGFGAFQTIDHLRHDDIFNCRKFRQQMMVLIDKPDVATAHFGPRKIRQIRAALTTDRHQTAIGPFKQSGDLKQG